MKTLLRRVLQLVVVILIVTFFTSLLTSLLPGDPITTITGGGAPPERIEEIRRANHLDENIVVRYKDWAIDFFSGDLGRYYVNQGSRGGEVWERAKKALPRSLLLILYTEIVTLLIAIPLGVWTAYRAGSLWGDRIPNSVAFALIAVPAFVLAAMLKLVVGLKLGWLPTIEWVDPGLSAEVMKEHIRHAIMPVAVLAVGQIAIYSRLLRSDMVATLQEDFILMAKSKGIPNRRILWRHALRPSVITLLTVAGLNIGTLLSGALVIEIIFNIDGMGSLIYDALGRRQYIALQSLVAVVAIAYVLINVVVDILYTMVDPRIRSARVG